MPTEPRLMSVKVHQIRVGPSWMDPIVMFLKDGALTNDKGEAKKIRRKAPRFWLSDEQKLYKRSFSGPYLLCIHPEVVEPLLEELHEGMVVIQEEGRYHIGLLLRVINGQVCRKKLRIMLGSAISAKGLPQASISLGAC